MVLVLDVGVSLQIDCMKKIGSDYWRAQTRQLFFE